MNERIIEIILYLITQIRKDTPIESIDVKHLATDGYTDVEIGTAFCWIADRAVFGATSTAPARNTQSFRILHESERALFQTDAYGYLLLMVQIGLLDEMELEMIISRAHVSGFQALGVGEVKELVSTLLAESGDISFGGSRLMLNAHDTVH
ncbi:MAG: hypothetical protein JWQ98_2127 [Chlorobi bacterium]|nr:hypothetical protein [Chlorobiota bacterium]